MKVVPSDWIICRADELGQVVAGGTPSTGVAEYWGGDIAWVTPADLSDYRGKIITGGARSITRRGLAGSSARLMPPGSILFSSRAPIGYVAIAGAELCTNQGFKNLIPSQGISSDYLYYYFLSIRELARSRASGTTFKELSAGGFASLPIALAPIVEQRAIVAKIEALFSELDKGIEQLQIIKQQLKQYRQAVLKAAFEGKLTAAWRAEQQAAGTLPSAGDLLEQIRREREDHYRGLLAEWQQRTREWEADRGQETGRRRPIKPSPPDPLPPQSADVPFTSPNGWIWLRLGAMVENPQYGTSKRCDTRAQGRSVLRIPNIVGGHIDSSDLKYSEFTDDECRSYKLEPGDILLIRSNGSISLVGRPALVTANDTHHLFAGYLIRLRPNGCPVSSRFLVWCLQAYQSRNQIEDKARSTSGVNNINSDEIRSLLVPVCSPAEQAQVIGEIESRLSVLDQLDAAVDSCLDDTEALRQSILKKAFEGRLLTERELTTVRTHPEYEPADKLLERIRTEKGLGDQPSTSRRSRRESKPVGQRQLRGNIAEVRSEAE